VNGCCEGVGTTKKQTNVGHVKGEEIKGRGGNRLCPSPRDEGNHRDMRKLKKKSTTKISMKPNVCVGCT